MNESVRESVKRTHELQEAVNREPATGTRVRLHGKEGEYYAATEETDYKRYIKYDDGSVKPVSVSDFNLMDVVRPPAAAGLLKPASPGARSYLSLLPDGSEPLEYWGRTPLTLDSVTAEPWITVDGGYPDGYFVSVMVQDANSYASSRDKRFPDPDLKSAVAAAEELARIDAAGGNVGTVLKSWKG